MQQDPVQRSPFSFVSTMLVTMFLKFDSFLFRFDANSVWQKSNPFISQSVFAIWPQN